MTQTMVTEDPAFAAAARSAGRAPRRAVFARAVGEAGPMLWLTAVEGGARVLSFGFYLVAARMFAPQGFGVVQYTITVSMLAIGLLQVLATAVMRELGAVRGDRNGIREVLGSSLAAAAGLWALTSGLCVIARAEGLASGASTLGLLVALTGTAALQIYYSIARGLGDPGRQAASYAGASLAQLVMVAALAAFAHPSPAEALVIYGASSLVPILLYEWRRPVLRGQSLVVHRTVVRRLWLISAPLVVAQVGYLIWNSLDQLWVQGTLGTFQIGLYAAAKNLSLALLVVPAGISGVLLPRVSQLLGAEKTIEARRLVIWGTAGSIAVSALLALMIGILRVPLLGDLYGHSYRSASGALAALSIGMVCYAGFATLTMAAVGWGRPNVYTAAIAVAMVLEGAVLEFFGHHSLTAAAVAYASSMAGALVFVVVLLGVRPLWSEAR